MSVEVNRGPMTPMYTTLWDEIARWYGARDVISLERKITVLSNRIGILSYSDITRKLYWYHICAPRKLYADIQCYDRSWSFVDDLIFSINWRTQTTHIPSEWCNGCGYKLTKNEQLQVKLGVLGERR